MLERFPAYVVVVNAEDLTIQRINPAYGRVLGSRDVRGLPVSELFSGPDLDQLIKLLKTAAREGQTIHTPPIQASVIDGGNDGNRMVHTAVPITDEKGVIVHRLFIYSEKLE